MKWKVLITGIFVVAMLGTIGIFFLKPMDFNIGRKINPLESNDGTREKKHNINKEKLTMEDKYEAKETKRDGNFIAYDNGVVYDTRTCLEWFAGPDKNTSWKKAKSWVENLGAAGGGWRMPTCNELSTLFRKGTGSKDISPLSRNITPLFKVRGQFIWSGAIGEIKGSIWSRWDASYFDYNFDGVRATDLFWFSSDFRSFAVRTRQPRNLMAAAYQKNSILVKDILDAGADVNAKDEEGYTALMMAIKDGPYGQNKYTEIEKIVQLLVDQGADVNAKQKYGHTALYYAKIRDMFHIKKILKQHGAEE